MEERRIYCASVDDFYMPTLSPVDGYGEEEVAAHIVDLFPDAIYFFVESPLTTYTLTWETTYIYRAEVQAAYYGDLTAELMEEAEKHTMPREVQRRHVSHRSHN